MKNNCPLRHENGNCLPHGGFCTSVSENVCEALLQAYDAGKEERPHGRWYKASPVGIESLKTISKNRDKLLQMRVEDFIRLFSTKPSDEVLAHLICIWLKKCDFCVLKGKCYQTAPENMTEHYPTNCISGINEYLESEAEK